MPARIRDRRLLLDESACDVVSQCRTCGATFGPFSSTDAARLAALDHWDAWHREPGDDAVTCRVHGCDTDATRLGLCVKHYHRQRRNGDPSTARTYRKRRTA